MRHSNHIRLAGVTACLVWLSSSNLVYAETLCQPAKDLIAGEDISLSLAEQPCSRVRVDGVSEQYFCAIEFPFRSAAARAQYDDYVTELRACFGEEAEIPVGPAVNHPDSYDQTVFEVRGRQISVALKDKGALQKTYVFVRVPAN